MILEVIKAVSQLVLLVVDIGLVVACSVVHFKRNEVTDGALHGGITLALLYLAGLITNLFHFFRHELSRMPQRTGWKKVKAILLILIPCSYLLQWSIMRIRYSDSLTVKCWTYTLRLFYCSTGSLVQAVFQSYLLVHLWWKLRIPDEYYWIMMAAAIFLTVHAILGVCDYIWIQYYDEVHVYMPAWDIILIFFTLTLNMSGRVTAMAVVMGTLGWMWLLIAVLSPFFLNLGIYIYAAVQADRGALSPLRALCRYFSLVPLALLSTMTVSDKRFLTILTTLAWLGSYLPQILSFHDEASYWWAWGVPTVAQIVALVVMMFKWEVFETAFQRFTRVAQGNPWIKLQTTPHKDRNEKALKDRNGNQTKA